MAQNDAALVIRLCELLVNAAEVIKTQQQVILQLGGTCNETDQSLIDEIETMVG